MLLLAKRGFIVYDVNSMINPCPTELGYALPL